MATNMGLKRRPGKLIRRNRWVRRSDGPEVLAATWPRPVVSPGPAQARPFHPASHRMPWFDIGGDACFLGYSF